MKARTGLDRGLRTARGLLTSVIAAAAAAAIGSGNAAATETEREVAGKIVASGTGRVRGVDRPGRNMRHWS